MRKKLLVFSILFLAVLLSSCHIYSSSNPHKVDYCEQARRNGWCGPASERCRVDGCYKSVSDHWVPGLCRYEYESGRTEVRRCPR